MSESHEHREMVLAMERTLSRICPTVQPVADVSSYIGGRQLPPMIGSRRPDIFARDKEQIFIGEVKTFSDLETKRSTLQIRTFIQYTEQNEGSFILGVYGQGADRAKTLLRFSSDSLQLTKCLLYVFDGMDYWFFTPNGKRKWHSI